MQAGSSPAKICLLGGDDSDETTHPSSDQRKNTLTIQTRQQEVLSVCGERDRRLHGVRARDIHVLYVKHPKFPFFLLLSSIRLCYLFVLRTVLFILHLFCVQRINALSGVEHHRVTHCFCKTGKKHECRGDRRPHVLPKVGLSYTPAKTARVRFVVHFPRYVILSVEGMLSLPTALSSLD